MIYETSTETVVAEQLNVSLQSIGNETQGLIQWRFTLLKASGVIVEDIWLSKNEVVNSEYLSKWVSLQSTESKAKEALRVQSLIEELRNAA